MKLCLEHWSMRFAVTNTRYIDVFKNGAISDLNIYSVWENVIDEDV